MDGIEISAAHQHLIDQFWSPRTNFRADEYGGCLENRLRFGMQVLQAVREAVGKDFCVGLRMWRRIPRGRPESRHASKSPRPWPRPA